MVLDQILALDKFYYYSYFCYYRYYYMQWINAIAGMWMNCSRAVVRSCMLSGDARAAARRGKVWRRRTRSCWRPTRTIDSAWTKRSKNFDRERCVVWERSQHNRNTDVWQILESVLILPTCGNLEILFLPLRWRYFLITIPSCIYGNMHQRAQSWPVGPLGFKNSCMLILIFFTRLYIEWQWRNFVPYLCRLVFAAILWVKLLEMSVTLLSLVYALSVG